MSTSPTVSPATDDLNRLKSEYADRKARFSGSETYSHLNPAFLFALQQRQRDMLALLRQEAIGPLADQRVLEIGCGYGGVLHEFQGYGMTPRLLHGTELLRDRIVGAHSRLPQLAFTQADGQRLPYAANRFDIVLQSTVFSSILDDTIKANIAQGNAARGQEARWADHLVRFLAESIEPANTRHLPGGKSGGSSRIVALNSTGSRWLRRWRVDWYQSRG